MEEITDIGARVARIRKEKGLSGEQLGTVLGIGRATVSQIENGKSKPTIDGLAKILEVYPELSAEWLITGSGEMLKAASPEAPMRESISDCWALLKAERVKTEAERVKVEALEAILKKHGVRVE